jgi:hypothetical protein
MAKISLFLGASLFLGIGLAAELRGVRPLASRTAYAVTCFTETIGVGATLVSPDQVRRLFGGEIDRSYVVVEVGFYSKTHAAFEVRHADFALRNRPSRNLVKPVDPSTIAATLARPADKTLPEVATSQAVAGYLFFPITEAASFYELDYTGNGAWLTLPLKP